MCHLLFIFCMTFYKILYIYFFHYSQIGMEYYLFFIHWILFLASFFLQPHSPHNTPSLSFFSSFAHSFVSSQHLLQVGNKTPKNGANLNHLRPKSNGEDHKLWFNLTMESFIYLSAISPRSSVVLHLLSHLSFCHCLKKNHDQYLSCTSFRNKECRVFTFSVDRFHHSH